ncbi:hypothetical protein GFB56_15510 [Ensifer sp. T173]|uniref:Uncharacterized protein n=1 Tax=Ensifer canadensis TaxID=555315 RepID=A0AAW4FJE2_9HYPH|nr:hypothetical protein [Ensifer canadensis]MBM3092213.1 hypothetical protein [Ensifer canadensis]UBI73938.1 hypothetical protein J3R84_10400 [Ensifer canadensis]
MAVKQQLEAMKVLFEKWVEKGVPKGVTVPRTLSDAVGWSCPEFGIRGVGSKRDLNTKSEKYSEESTEIARLLDDLYSAAVKGPGEAKVEPEKPKRKRQYVSREVRDLATEERLKGLKKQVELANGKVHVARDLVDAAEAALKRERYTIKQLTSTIKSLEAENAELKRIVATQGGALTLVR